MYVGFPHMGNAHIGIRGLFKALGILTIDLPPVNRLTVELGAKYSPECSCLPFKTVLGNYIQALEKGADCLIMLGGCGPCRFGYFGNLQEKILRDLGYDFKMIILEPLDWRQTLRQLQETFSPVSWKQLIYASRLAWGKTVAADTIESFSHFYRARQSRPGIITGIYQRGLEKIDKAYDLASLRTIVKEVEGEMKAAVLPFEPEIKIALIGDIYTLIEPYVNYQTDLKLGEKGVQVERSIYSSRWLKENFIPWEKKKKRRKMLRDAKGYLKNMVGGHGLDTIANAVRYSREGFDGIIQILPMTCMPEIVAESILPRVAEDYQIPIMSLAVDEHSSDTGLQTRLEAFIDLIAQRKKDKKDYFLSKVHEAS
ncbi:MAG TPA: CoA protein activase [Clostridia bacterium]|nr:CoA protein activase [Clostridia bacterium]